MGSEWTNQFEVIPIDADVTELDWALLLGGAALTLICAAAFIYWLFKLLLHFYLANSGRISIGDRPFWKRMTISLLLILALMTGVWVGIMEGLYEQMRILLRGWST